ncbi:MAG: hypothetical protein ACREE6_16655 [Limisphaerales bacterium]
MNGWLMGWVASQAVRLFREELVRADSCPLLRRPSLAWWLRRRTTVPLRWVAERLQMGQYTRVAQAVSRMNRKSGRQLRLLREKRLALDNQIKRVDG